MPKNRRNKSVKLRAEAREAGPVVSNCRNLSPATFPRSLSPLREFYVRVSSGEQHTEMQERALREYVQRPGDGYHTRSIMTNARERRSLTADHNSVGSLSSQSTTCESPLGLLPNGTRIASLCAVHQTM
jgi:hypothetical protein